MIYTYVHTKIVPPALWNVAHLYEHMFFENFYNLVRQRGIDPGVIGYMGGETFQDIIFVSVGFYNKAIAEMYEAYVAKNRVDHTFLAIGIGGCEAEERVTFVINDQQALERELQVFDQLPWVEVSELAPQYIIDHEDDADGVIAIRKSAERFRDVHMVMYLESPTRHEAAVWLRLSIVMDDVMIRAMRNIYPSYAPDSEPTMRKGNRVARIMEHRFERQVTLKQIRQSMQEILENFDTATNMPYILEHMDMFGGHALWADMAITHYKYTGYLVGNNKIAELATPQMIEHIIKKIQVKAQAA